MKMTESIFTFVGELDAFSYKLSVLDRVWNILFPDDEGKWQHLHVTKYKRTYYITAVAGNSGGLEVEPKKVVGIENHDHSVTTWDPLISSARKWLLAQDNIGIIPSYAYLHRANQHFSEDSDVFDVMYYDDLGRFKRRIGPFISWEPLPVEWKKLICNSRVIDISEK